MLSGLEIQDALRAFAKKWVGYTGSERSEAQTFLNELFACYGTSRQGVGALFEDFKSSAGFMDLHLPGVLIVEMKAPGVPLEKAADQPPLGSSSWSPKPLPQNSGKCFQGPIPVGAGFIISTAEAQQMLSDASASYEDVVRPYLVGDDIANDPQQHPLRWIIDFAQATLESARRYPAALALVRKRVKPFRDTVRREGHRTRWWQFGEPRVALRASLLGRPRYAAVGRVGKRMLVSWQSSDTCPSDLTVVFAFDDDYSMGILLSRAHDAWAWAQSSTLETRLRYTPSSVFETFPWPDPVDAATRERVAAAASALYTRRSEHCIEHNLGLTKLYNLMDDGGFVDLAKLHRDLDIAVAAAYGWPASVAQNPAELVERLTELNRQIATGERDYHPFPDPDELG